MSRLLFTLVLLSVPCYAQTAQIPPLTAPLPAVVDPGQPVNCTLNGKKVSCLPLPQRTLLKAGQTTTATTTAPVSLSGTKAEFTCDFSHSATTKNPDGTTTVTGVACTMVTK